MLRACVCVAEMERQGEQSLSPSVSLPYIPGQVKGCRGREGVVEVVEVVEVMMEGLGDFS